MTFFHAKKFWLGKNMRKEKKIFRVSSFTERFYQKNVFFVTPFTRKGEKTREIETFKRAGTKD